MKMRALNNRRAPREGGRLPLVGRGSSEGNGGLGEIKPRRYEALDVAEANFGSNDPDKNKPLSCPLRESRTAFPKFWVIPY